MFLLYLLLFIYIVSEILSFKNNFKKFIKLYIIIKIDNIKKKGYMNDSRTNAKILY